MRRTAKTPGVKGFGNALNDTIPAANCQRQISRTGQFGRISLFERSRSDCVIVAVGLSPRDNGRKRLRVAERRLNRSPNRTLQASLRDARFSRSLPVG